MHNLNKLYAILSYSYTLDFDAHAVSYAYCVEGIPSDRQ